MDMLLVALGGAVGSAGRFGIGRVLQGLLGNFPAGTLAANVLAGFVIGLVTGLASAGAISPRGKLLLTTGLCGGLSTFSTFSLETVQLAQEGVWPLALLNVFANIGICLVAVLAGQWVAARLSVLGR